MTLFSMILLLIPVFYLVAGIMAAVKLDTKKMFINLFLCGFYAKVAELVIKLTLSCQ